MNFHFQTKILEFAVYAHMAHHHYCLELAKISLQKALPGYKIGDVKFTIRFQLSSQQGLLGVKTQQRVSIRSSFPFGHLNGLLSREKTFRQQKLNSAGVELLGVIF